MEKWKRRVGQFTTAVRSGLQRIFQNSSPSTPIPSSAQPQPFPQWIQVVGGGSVFLLLLLQVFIYIAELYFLFGVMFVLTGMLALLLLIHLPNSWLLRGWQWYRYTNHVMIKTRFSPANLKAPFRKMVRLVYVLEIAVILSVALAVTEPYRDFDSSQKLGGNEQEWLTSSAYQTSQSIREVGYIRLWQPYLEYGESLVENPFAFVFNPLSTLPSVLYGGVNGIKLSIVVYVILVGLGGWFLGRVLGFGSVGRVLLGLLLIGKGNMHAMLEGGYFQLGVSQAYMPWIIGGAIAAIRHWKERWSPVLLAVMVVLLFFAGNIWYTLPMLASVALLAITHLLFFQGKIINLPMIRRLMWAGVLTMGLAAITLIPIWERQDLIGDHPPVQGAGLKVDLDAVIEQFYNGDELQYYDDRAPGDLFITNRFIFFYSYVVPRWFVVMMFAMFLPLQPFLYVPSIRQGWRVWSVGIVMIVFCTLWGAGQNPVMAWAYEHIELLSQWRFVGRALGVASFWIAVLVAMRVDGLAQAIVHPYWRQKSVPILIVLTIQIALLVVLVDTAYSAASEVNDKWNIFGDTIEADDLDETCLDWLRQRHPDEPLTVYRPGYNVMYPYMKYHVRQFGIEADFRMLPIDSTISYAELTKFWPRYAVAWDELQRDAIKRVGYDPVVGSPAPQGRSLFCLYEREEWLPYAFSIPRLYIQNANDETFNFDHIQPIEQVEHQNDQVTVWTRGDPDIQLVVTASEIAYPGWEATVNGEDAELESVGGQLGVVLPPGAKPYEIVFSYRPTLFYRAGVISLVTIGFTIFYLLRGERLVKKMRRRFGWESDKNVSIDNTNQVE